MLQDNLACMEQTKGSRTPYHKLNLADNVGLKVGDTSSAQPKRPVRGELVLT